jgi:hypothetical protein
MSAKPPIPDDSMRGMKLMVSAMGVVLICGVLVLVYAGFRKIEREGKPVVAAKAVCEQKEISAVLPAGTVQLPLHFEGNHIDVIVRLVNGDYGMYRYDRCRGTLESSMVFNQEQQ